MMIIAVYVDDRILATKDSDELVAVTWELSSRFKMKDMGELHTSSSALESSRTIPSARPKLQQTQYVKRMQQRFNITEGNPVSTCTWWH